MRQRTKALIDLDRRYVWHPFTQMQEWAEQRPLVIERGEGSFLVDTEGRRYLDGVSSLWVTVHGHGRPEITKAIQQQAAELAHSTLLGLANVPSAELAGRLVELAPDGLTKVFYSDSGSTAVEIALKMAFQYWQHRGRGTKRAFVSLAEAYHGDTIGAVSVGGIGVFHAIFGPLLFDGFRIPTPHGYRAPELDGEQLTERSLTALEQLLEQHADEVAAVIMEPLVQGAAGIIVHPRGFLGGVAKLCREHGVLLILDEVATGFGRTGTMFACEQEAVAPDLMCLAKGITGGYLPLAATLTTEEVFDAFLAPQVEGKQFFHGHTYTGNPIACAAALASLDIFERDGTLVRVRTRASELASALRERVAGLPVVGEVRQRGLMIGIELAADGPTRRPFSPQRLAGIKVCARAREHGVILRPLGDVIVLMPPLSMSAEEGELLVSAVADAIQDELL